MIRDLYITKLHNLNSKFGLEHSNKSNNTNKAKKFKSKAIKTKEGKCTVMIYCRKLGGVILKSISLTKNSEK